MNNPKCKTCDGSGEVDVVGFDPLTGQQIVTHGTCPTCGGSGETNQNLAED